MGLPRLAGQRWARILGPPGGWRGPQRKACSTELVGFGVCVCIFKTGVGAEGEKESQADCPLNTEPHEGLDPRP